MQLLFRNLRAICSNKYRVNDKILKFIATGTTLPVFPLICTFRYLYVGNVCHYANFCMVVLIQSVFSFGLSLSFSLSNCAISWFRIFCATQSLKEMSTQWTGSDWAKIVPLMLASAAVGFYISRRYPHREATWINKKHQKEVGKLVHSVDIEDIPDKKHFCRCWQSKQFPYCDGSHAEHNKITGDNVGPLTVKHKTP